MRKKKFLTTTWVNVYEDETPPKTDPPADPPPATDPPETKVFTQDDVDRIIKSRLRKQEEQQKTIVTELNALRAKADLTKEERQDWEQRIEQLNNTLLSEQELSAKKLKREQEAAQQALADKDTEIQRWQGLFTTSTITRSLTDAAVEQKAFHPEQIVSLLDRKTRLVEELHDGKPTGNLVPRVRFEDVDDKGKPVVLEISPSEAVKRMTEIGKYQNLFEGKGIGGVGARTHTDGGRKQNLSSMAKDPAAYIAARRDGSLTLD